MSHLPKNYVQVHRDKVNQDPTLRALYLEKKKQENKLAAQKKRVEQEALEKELELKTQKNGELEQINQELRQKVVQLEAKLKEKDEYIEFLKSPQIQPDNDKTVQRYQEIQQHEAFDMSCVSKLVHEKEVEKLLFFLSFVDFSKVPKAVQDKRKTIYLGMEGCCRNYPYLKSGFRGYRVIAVDCSKPMLDYAKKQYKIDERDLFCSKVQDFDFHIHNNKISLCVCWWNACYLPKEELRQYLIKMLLTLRCQDTAKKFGTAISYDGYIILAEPVGPYSTKNDFQGQSLVINPAAYYEDLFKELDLEIIKSRDYEEYAANSEFNINAERIWLLRENPNSDLNRASQQKRLFKVERSEKGIYEMSWQYKSTKTVHIKKTSQKIFKAPSKQDPSFDKRKQKLQRDMNKKEGQRKLDFGQATQTIQKEQVLNTFFSTMTIADVQIQSPRSIVSDINDLNDAQTETFEDQFDTQLQIQDKDTNQNN